MEHPAVWRSRPIFISSTFQDMQAERDHLRTHVFPALEERLRARRHHLEWVDLRLGVATVSQAEEGARELQVLKVCLAEVKRCRPFLIVLLGDRYGWVPPAERISAAALEEGFGGELAGRSVTDLEISFGVLGDSQQQARSVFYFRAPLPYDEMPPELAALYADARDSSPAAADRRRRLAALKREIETRLPDRVRRYAVGWDSRRQAVAGLEAWGRSVLEDIWSELAGETASADTEAEISWQQAERNALDDHVEDCARDFFGRAQILSRLESLASSVAQQEAAWGLCLTGAAGSGKSAIFGELHRRLKHSNTFVLAHAAGASPRAPSVEDMLRRWIQELGAALDTDQDVSDNADPEAIEATFQSLLSAVAEQRRVVVLIDALDQFQATTRGQFVTWLPRAWPANARLIATAIPGQASTALADRGVETMPLPPLDMNEARGIAEGICARYHRTLEPEVLHALLAKSGKDGPAAGNTLWLVLAVEELNLVDADDFARAKRSFAGTPAEQLHALMLDIVAELPSDTVALYRSTFDRAGKLFGVRWARAFLGLIAVSRAGWRESDFRALLPLLCGEPWDELRFASLRRLFRGQVRQRGTLGQWDFTHAQMRVAVRELPTAESVSETELHGKLADHLLSLTPDDPLRQNETMLHLLGSEQWARAAGFYGDSSLTKAELDGATHILADAVLTAPKGPATARVNSVLRLLDTPRDPEDRDAEKTAERVAERVMFDLGAILEHRAELDVRACILEGITRAFDRLVDADVFDPARPLGHFDSARALAQSISLIMYGSLLLAQSSLPAALNSFRAALVNLESLEQTAPGKFDNAIAQSNSGIGDVLKAQGDLPAALDAYRTALAIRERLAEADPADVLHQRELAVSQTKVADIQLAQGNLAAALDTYLATLAAHERLAGAAPGDDYRQHDVCVSQGRVGDILLAQGNLAPALDAYRAALAIADRLARADPGHTGMQDTLSLSQANVGRVLEAQGNLPAALDAYRASLAIQERLAKADPDKSRQCDLAASRTRVARLLALQAIEKDSPDPFRAHGVLIQALDSLRQDRTIIERGVRLSPDNVRWKEELATLDRAIAALEKHLTTLEDYAVALEIANAAGAERRP